MEEVLGLHPSGWTLVQHTTKTILRLAGLRPRHPGRARCQHHHRAPPVTCFTCGWWRRSRREFAIPPDTTSLSEAEAAKLVREQDQARRRYVRRYFNSEIDDPTLYDVTLNTGRFGFARTAEVIAQLALQHHNMNRLLTLGPTSS